MKLDIHGLRRASAVLVLLVVIAGEMIGISACKKVQKEMDQMAEDVLVAPIDKANTTRLQADLTTLRRAITGFQAQHGRNPESLAELAQKGMITRIPREPFGGEWKYDPTTGEVHSSTRPDL